MARLDNDDSRLLASLISRRKLDRSVILHLRATDTGGTSGAWEKEMDVTVGDPKTRINGIARQQPSTVQLLTWQIRNNLA